MVNLTRGKNAEDNKKPIDFSHIQDLKRIALPPSRIACSYVGVFAVLMAYKDRREKPYRIND